MYVGVSVTVLALLHKAGENMDRTIHPVTSPHKLHSIITFPFIFIFNLLNPLISDECHAVSSLTHGTWDVFSSVSLLILLT